MRQEYDSDYTEKSINGCIQPVPSLLDNVFDNYKNYQLPPANNDGNLEENGLAIFSKKEIEKIIAPILTYDEKKPISIKASSRYSSKVKIIHCKVYW